MALNIHPIFVHIPIAFLTFYSLFEIIKIKKLTQKQFWHYTKFILLLIGVLGGVAALITGDLAEEGVTNAEALHLIEVHSTFATITAIYFTVLLVLYLAHLTSNYFQNTKLQKTTNLLNKIYHKLVASNFGIIIGLIGLILITITGSLGGSIVYGPIDPVAQLAYNLFV